MKMNIFVYGTLLSGLYNCIAVGLDTQNKLEDSELVGFVMYSLGYYPAVVYSGNKEDIVIGEVWECNDDIFEVIDRMETGAGYRQREVSTGKNDAIVYEYAYNIDYYKKVVNGDWKEHSKGVEL